MANAKGDARIVAALGERFEKFRRLALMVYEQPKTRAYAESEMKRMLEAMTDAERNELRQALIADGAYGRRMR